MFIQGLLTCHYLEKMQKKSLNVYNYIKDFALITHGRMKNVDSRSKNVAISI